MPEAEPMRHFSFEAVLFDLDGTLVDSEGRTEKVVRELLDGSDLDPEGALDLTQLHGVTWAQVETLLGAAFPSLAGRALGDELRQAFHASSLADPPLPIRGARTALATAASHLPTAVVTSSNRESLEHSLAQLGVDTSALVTICAEDVQRSKPAPDGFLAAAARLGIEPSRCLVFEDSIAGLRAARAAGMTAIAIARDRGEADRRALGAIAAAVIADYTELPPDFFAQGAAGSRP